PDRAGRHDSLGIKLLARFERIGDLDDLQRAINHNEEALATTPLDHPDRAGRDNSLGIKLLIRFERKNDIGDLRRAIEHSEAGLAATPSDHPDRAAMCIGLGRGLHSRYLCLRFIGDLDRALLLYREAFHCSASPPRVRINAARRVASLLYSDGRFHESSSILEDAVNLMPAVNLQILGRDDQQHIISELSGLASDAASVALQAGRGAYYALNLLELGRGTIMGVAIDSRSGVSDLRIDHPLVYSQFHSLRVEIDSAVHEGCYAGDEASHHRRNRATARRWDAVNEMEAIIVHIRTLPGYGRFLLPPSPEDLMKIAIYGPIVVFNCTTYRSDAVIVTTSAITSLELPKLNHEETAHWMRQVNRKIKDLLIWLWDSAVGPVFDKLEHDGTIVSDGVQGSNLKRVWWIGVGQLSMAPFHAAGDHSPGSTRNTLSRAISTYIPTIKALSYARQKQLQLYDDPRLLIISMAETPGAIDLPGVDAEVKYILDATSGTSVETTVLSHPTPTEVLKKILRHEIVHFACHGVSSLNPSDSHLILFTPDGNGADKLLARDISNIVAQNAYIAYLSGCYSAKNPSINLADEVIHLASAFQLAGFSHTLANMWETDDRASGEVARDFYNLLFRYKGNGDEHHWVAAAFHKAVKTLRD
ncbi:unnamed protein product, partial [Tuber aestivum]